MKSFLISDTHDTLVGMSLAGIQGVIAENKDDILIEISKAFKDKEIGIIILTESNFEKVKEEVMNIKLKVKYPLIVEIPGRDGLIRGSKFITQYINDSIGIKL